MLLVATFELALALWLLANNPFWLASLVVIGLAIQFLVALLQSLVALWELLAAVAKALFRKRSHAS